MHLQKIQTKIHELRGQKVILAPIAIGVDLAELYEVETRTLNQAVKRNLNRFPLDFMFQITRAEFETMRTQIEALTKANKTLISQIVISKIETRGGNQKLPFAFTEQGVAMLSAVLRSDKAINVSIAIIKAFVFLKQYALTHKDLTEKLKELETTYNKQFKDVYEAINYLLQKDKQAVQKDKLETEQIERKRIGYK